MELTERCFSVLLVSATEKFNHSMSALLPAARYHPVDAVSDGASAKRRLLETGYDLILINGPLPDELGVHLALDLCEKTASGVLLLVKAEVFPEVEARTAPGGVLTLSKPVAASTILQSLQLLCATRERLRRMEKKTASMEEKMEEIRIVNRAKWLLIDQLKMTEAEAHRFLEKQAMDRCVTRRAIAEQILATYK